MKLASLLTSFALFLFASCNEPKKVGEVELTPEEKALNATLDNPDLFAPEPDAEDGPETFVLNTANEVSILGYHKFADSQSRDDMVISTKKFRDQLQAIKDAEIPVISMSDFLDWRAGKINIPDQCILITMDDGWVSVYTHALPILKEFGYPFSIYLYKNYINIGGRSLSYEQIKEIQEFGGEIGSHSVSHSDMHGKKSSMSADNYTKWLHTEIDGSKAFIKEKIGVDTKVFAYPYGRYNQQVVDVLMEGGYTAGLTVNGQKISFETPMGELGRFIVLGTNDNNFKYATTFRGRGAAVGSNLLADPEPKENEEPGNEEPLVAVFPRPNSTITDRAPLITVDLSKLENVDEKSISMKIGGFGKVTPDYDKEQQTLTFQIPQKIRATECQVSTSLKRKGQSDTDVIQWKFSIDRSALYLPAEVTEPVSNP